MNKPVAWINTRIEDDRPFLEWNKEDSVGYINIPLYTHPVKELKNIVVASVTCSCGKVMEVTNLQPVKELTDEEIFEVASRFPFIESGYERYEFAKAILRKAQDK